MPSFPKRCGAAAAAALWAAAAAALFAQSGQAYRRSAVMRGNLVKTVFGNWGVIGQPAEKGARGAWIYENNGYIGDVSPLVGAEITAGGQRIHSVVICPVSRPTKQSELSPSGKPWGFEPVAGFLNETQEGVALFSDPSSWPSSWPDRRGDPEDPGWSGSWNGFFGKSTTASEECVFVMDDRNDEEFNVASNNQWRAAFHPDSTDPGRNGLGLEVKVRGMQWSDFLAQDCAFWLYEISNRGTTDYTKTVFGMLVGTYVGVTSTEDYREYDDDYSFFDVEKDLTYTADFDDDAGRDPRWTGPVGVVGYAYLESPGNPYDGIDNDGDAASGAAPLFNEDDFRERVIRAGDRVVLIDRAYRRTVVTVPSEPTAFVTGGDTVRVTPGVTALVEGNAVRIEGRETVNPNVYDGIDNDLDGLIDENTFVHYRQIRRDQNGNVLIDRLSPVRHVDYLSGAETGDALIDERRDDGLDNDGDWSALFDDVGADGVAATNDRGEGDGRPTDGEPNFDQTDVDESDQIGLTSFEYFTPAREFSMADDEDLWRRLAPGYFDVPASIVNNRPQRGEDGDFIYGSGYFPLRAGETQRFSLALVYGEGGGPDVEIEDLLRNRETVQRIYDSDYRFPPAPEKPTLTAAPGDGRVTLYWDRRAELSVDPVLRVNDFEGYKLYRATDQDFNDVFGITDAEGTPIGYKPIAQFDLKNGVSGYFRAGAELFQQGRGASFDLGSDTGLEHVFVDTDVENGRRYFYALAAYDRGDAGRDIFPKENDKRIDVLPSGAVRTFQNTAVAMPNAPVAGLPPPEGSVRLASPGAAGTGGVFLETVNRSARNGHRYRLEFHDTSNDGADNDGDGFVDGRDSSETVVPVTTDYSVLDLTGVAESFVSRDTAAVRLSHTHIDAGTFTVRDPAGEAVPPERWTLDAANGRIQGRRPGDLARGDLFSVSYRYHPVYRSPHIEGSPFAAETRDTDVFDGLRLHFTNHWTVVVDTLRTRWGDRARSYDFTLRVIDTYLDDEIRLLGLPRPGDYRIDFFDGTADTSLRIEELFLPAVPVNFRITNVTDGRTVDFGYNNTARNGKLSPYDELVLVEPGLDGSPAYTWDLYFTHRRDSTFDFGAGDSLFIAMKKPFRSGDAFEFEAAPEAAERAAAASELDRIRVVPNPYVAATSHELPLPPAVTSGRGDRRIDFIHLPAGATVRVFTSRGEPVVTLRHGGGLYDGTVSWNLKSEENLDVAAGVYFYVVESDAGVKRGKLAVIK